MTTAVFIPFLQIIRTADGFFGGLCEVRNTVEAVVLVALLGYPELAWLHLALPLKVVVITITLLPLGVFALMGIGGESLLQYALHMAAYAKPNASYISRGFKPLKLKKKKGNSVPQNQKAKTQRSVQSWLGVKAVRNGVIELSGGRYVRILEVKPVHFALRSAESKPISFNRLPAY